MRIYLSLLFLSAAGVPASLAAPPEPPQFLRVGVVDESGSMGNGSVSGSNPPGKGEPSRIQVTRDELLDLGRQLPPSARHPIVLITFDSAVRTNKTFTDKAEYDKAVNALGPHGSTSIASGLKAAIAEIERHAKARDVWLLLYTDGEDGDTKAILAEEAKLAKIFQDRFDLGRRQSVILKRWARANADLLAKLKEREKIAPVIDAETASLRTVSLRPKVSLVGARWAKGQGRAVEAVFETRIDGSAATTGMAPVGLRCAYPGASGDARAELTPGKPARLTVRLPVADTKDKSIKVPFVVESPAQVAGKDSLLLPMLELDRVEVSLDVPAVVGVLTGQLTLGAASWADPLTRKAVVKAELTLELRTRDDLPWPGSVEVGIAGVLRCRVRDAGALRFDAPGKQTFALEIETTADAARMPVALELTPRGEAGITFAPANLPLRGETSAPPPIATELRARPTRVVTARWANVENGVASFDTAVEIDVAGPLEPGTVLTLICPAGVSDLKLTPKTIRKGKQTVHVRGKAVFKPGPATATFTFVIQPPPSKGCVSVQPAGPLVLTVRGPAQARMGLEIDGRRGGPHRVTVADLNAGRVRLLVRPYLAKVGGEVSASLRARGGLAIDGDATALSTRKAVPVVLRPTKAVSSSFFWDTPVECELELTPTSSSVAPSKTRVVVIVEAPFKRLALRLALGVGGVLSLILLAVLFYRLTRPARRAARVPQGAAR